jgi:hypothetical protein
MKYETSVESLSCRSTQNAAKHKYNSWNSPDYELIISFAILTVYISAAD